MSLRAIRGATTAERNDPQVILAATRQLLEAILDRNPQLSVADLVSAIFTLTPDLNAVFPAQAAREMGWTQVPMMCAQEIPVPGALPLCIRVLLHCNTNLSAFEIRHVYLEEAVRLRPDLQQAESTK
ncbi:MAG TPA: chorismate mutase [Anaerolineales bacterium]|nr:chorismate mutase [Anaerolineales bacterium]